MTLYGLFDKDGDAVDDLFGYTDEGAANDALSAYEHGGRNTYDGVHVGEQCGCPYGSFGGHEYDDEACVLGRAIVSPTGRSRVSDPELTRFPRNTV